MTLALFDLDNTLIAGDSDHAWGEFIVERGLIDAGDYARTNDKFYSDYVIGCLDIEAYLRFALEPLSQYSIDELNSFHQDFMAKKIASMWLAAADKLIEQHRNQGHRLVVITATNRFVVEPIVKQLGITEIICSEPEIIDSQYTGNFVDEPCYREGKISKLNRWLNMNNESISGAWFYSDSFNDIPLLEKVDNPVAVDPDPKLRAHAESFDWPVTSLRQA